MTTDQITSLNEALSRLRAILKLQEEHEYTAILCWAAQAHLIDLLNTVWYLGFSGPTGSGKSTAVEACVGLTPDGEVLGDTTPAYLAAVLNEGKAIGIQELGRLLRNRDGALTPLLNGYRDGAVLGRMVKGDKDTWQKQTVSVFGPKVFDFHVGLDGHLLNRTIVIEMVPDHSVRRALRGERKATELAPVKAWLAAEAARAKEQWNRERVEEIWNSQAFEERVEALSGKTARDHIVGAIMLTVADALSWDIAHEIKLILRGNRKTTDDFGVEAEVAAAIASLMKGPEDDRPLAVHALLKRINDDRAEIRAFSLSQHELAKTLIDLGFDRKTAYKKFRGMGPLRDKWVIYPHLRWENLARAARLAPEAQVAGPEEPEEPEDLEESGGEALSS